MGGGISRILIVDMGKVKLRGKYYQIDFYYNGKRIRKNIKTKSKRIAESYLNKELSDAILGKVSNVQRIEFIRFKPVYLDFINKEKRPATFESYSIVLMHFEKFLKESTNCVYLNDISRQTINEYKHYRVTKVNPNSVNIELRSLRAFFNEAIRRAFLKENPMKDVSFVETPKRRAKKLPLEDYKRIILEARLRYPNPINDSFVPLLITYIYTGCRKSELINLRWDQIDFNKEVIYIESDEQFKTKTGEQRVVPMFPAMIKELNKLARKKDYVFYSPDGCKYTHRFYRKLKDIVKYLDCGWVTIKDLRHSLASYLTEQGVSYTVVATILGHKSIRTTLEFYQSTVFPEVRRAIKSLPDFETIRA